MSDSSKAPFRNPGWAGNTGEFDLTEAQVRGDDYVGKRPKEGGHPSGASTSESTSAAKHRRPSRDPTSRSKDDARSRSSREFASGTETRLSFTSNSPSRKANHRTDLSGIVKAASG